MRPLIGAHIEWSRGQTVSRSAPASDKHNAIQTDSPNEFRIIISFFAFATRGRAKRRSFPSRERAFLLRERCQANHVLSKSSISFTVEDDNVINGCRGATALDVQPRHRSTIAHAEHVADGRRRRRNCGKRRKAISASSHTYKLSGGGAEATVIESVDRARGRGKRYWADAERCRAIIIAHLAFERQFGVRLVRRLFAPRACEPPSLASIMSSHQTCLRRLAFRG